jgi:hypothetical protein
LSELSWTGFILTTHDGTFLLSMLLFYHSIGCVYPLLLEFRVLIWTTRSKCWYSMTMTCSALYILYSFNLTFFSSTLVWLKCFVLLLYNGITKYKNSTSPAWH